MEFKDRIKTLRVEHDMSTANLGTEFKKSDTAIRMWEAGKSYPDAKTLIELAKFFKCSTDYLLGLSRAPDIRKGKEIDTSVEAIGKSLNVIIEHNATSIDNMDDLELIFTFMELVLCGDDREMRKELLTAFRDIAFAFVELKGWSNESGEESFERMSLVLQTLHRLHYVFEKKYETQNWEDTESEHRIRLKKEIANNANTQK